MKEMHWTFDSTVKPPMSSPTRQKRNHRHGDEDEIEIHQGICKENRRSWVNSNKSFVGYILIWTSYVTSAQLGDTLELDIPFRELSFEGVPFRTGVRLQPTTECLVHLTDPPFLVVTLAEIEVASLERVQLQQGAPLHINSIPSSQMGVIKNWLDSVDAPMAVFDAVVAFETVNDSITAYIYVVHALPHKHYQPSTVRGIHKNCLQMWIVIKEFLVSSGLSLIRESPPLFCLQMTRTSGC
ncbi:hypothetical protein EV421DRAFT_1734733 [Armillaria borealis]|uniref:FACT complex subunit n=1 Tax=Armillaria borealis TaxID=47425 RepID=A0AA39JS26_9AGAR|nr:hypothetical protein EV421DRAFT_1734733 [Armillaria borealis]